MMRDVDREWREKHGSAEQPCEFAGRLARGELTDGELAAMAETTTPNEAFAAIYPDYVSLDAYREAAFAVNP